MAQILTVNAVALWVIVLLNLLLTLALVRRLNASPPTATASQGIGIPVRGMLTPGERAPDFTAETLAGDTVTLAAYAGHPVAFLFVGPYCKPCREGLPSYETAYLDAVRAGAEVVLVSVEDRGQTRAFVDELDVHLPVLVAPQESNSFMEDYKVTGTPAYCFIDADGVVRSVGYPSVEWGEFKTLVETWRSSKKPLPALVPSGGRVVNPMDGRGHGGVVGNG